MQSLLPCSLISLALLLMAEGSRACSGWHESHDFTVGYDRLNHFSYPFLSLSLFTPLAVFTVRQILLHVATHHLSLVLICSTVDGNESSYCLLSLFNTDWQASLLYASLVFVKTSFRRMFLSWTIMFTMSVTWVSNHVAFLPCFLTFTAASSGLLLSPSSDCFLRF